MSSKLRARLLEDCANNLRIVYGLPTPLTVELLRAAGATKVTVNPFSTYVHGASDHVTASFDDQATVRGEGTVGAREIVVTFGSLHGRATPEAVMQLENKLEHALSCNAGSS